MIASTIGDVSGIVAAIATVIAVIVSFITVRAARATVTEARLARKESSKAHADAMLEEQRLISTTRAIHAEEMDERDDAFVRDYARERLAQLNRVARLIGRAGDTARHELIHRDAAKTWSPLPGILSELEVAAWVFTALGGDTLNTVLEFASRSKGYRQNRESIVAESGAELLKLTTVANAEHERLKALLGNSVERAVRRHTVAL